MVVVNSGQLRWELTVITILTPMQQTAVDTRTPGSTIIPIIISTDKTTLTSFGGKTAYPMYLTIGNVPKEIRRKPSRNAQILIGYLPATSLDHITCTAVRRRTVGNLFHYCLDQIMDSLKGAGRCGVALRSGDGVWRRCHPILAVFVGDYPEQLLVACLKKGLCVSCPIPWYEVGVDIAGYAFRDLDVVLDALGTLPLGPTIYTRTCREAGIKPIQHPFWEELPYSYIFRSFPPDILHQLLQGLIKHLVAWVRRAYGDEPIDIRCHHLPPNHYIRLFLNGITHLKRVSGREHSQIASILLGVIADLPLPNHLNPSRLVAAVRAILDFLYLAQYPVHTPATLDVMKDALSRFHENKQVFIDLEIRNDFEIPKAHAAEHYADYIELFGTADNYNTEYTERLHIDFAKDAYHATNCKEELPQMTLWLERREKVIGLESLIRWRLAGRPQPSAPISVYPGVTHERFHQMAKAPSETSISLGDLRDNYHALSFNHALACFIISQQSPTTRWNHISRKARRMDLSVYRFDVYHSLKFTIIDPYHLPKQERIVDHIHAQPIRTNNVDDCIAARFDTALVDRENGLTGPARKSHSD